MVKKSNLLLLLLACICCFFIAFCTKKSDPSENAAQVSYLDSNLDKHPAFSLTHSDMPKKNPFLLAYFADASFVNEKEMITDILLKKDFISSIAPGPFTTIEYDELNNNHSWKLKGIPNVFVWHNNQSINGTEAFLITDFVGMPQKASVTNISNAGGTMSFLIPNEEINKKGKYYIYFKKKVDDEFFSWIQPVEFVD